MTDLFDPTLIVVLLLNLSLMAFARKILGAIYHEPEDSPGFRKRVNVFRVFNGVIIISFVMSRLFDDVSHNAAYAAFSVLLVLYLSYACLHLFNYWVRVRYGKQRDVDGSTQLVDTYNSRLINILSAIFISIIALVTIVRILGFDSLLETGGAIGIIGVFLALTQGAWAPDIISGLVILNSKMLDSGDVVELHEGEKLIGVIYKTRIFYTEMLNLTNNHRIMIRNSRLREQTIHNLSKFASAKGLRERMAFNIDYSEDEERVRQMFVKAFETAIEDKDICLEANYPIEVRVNNAGDFAVEWCCYYYTKEIKRVIDTRQRFCEVVLKTSKEMGISLATPSLHVVNQTPV